MNDVAISCTAKTPKTAAAAMLTAACASRRTKPSDDTKHLHPVSLARLPWFTVHAILVEHPPHIMPARVGGRSSKNACLQGRDPAIHL
jgi:hypothetical protein